MEDKEKVEPIEPTENPRPRTQFSDLREAYLKERGMQDGRPKKPFKPKQELRMKKTITPMPKKLAPDAEEKAEEYKRLKD